MIKTNKPLLDMYIIEGAILANSITVAIGDAVIIDTAAPHFVTQGAGTAGIILGTVVAIKNGPSGGNSYLQVESITTSGTNQTIEQINVDILASNNLATMTADLDAPAGTTPNSQFFGYFDLSATAGELDESTYSATVEKQFLSYGLLPGSTSTVIGVWTKIAQA